MSEKNILEGCIKCDPECQHELVKRYSGILFTVTRRYCKDTHSAKDALQEGLIRILQNISKYDPQKGSLTPWMKRIVANESLRILKKEKSIFTENIEDISPLSFDVSILDKLHEEDLIEIIQKLPNGYREVFNMYIIEGYSHKEIADILKIKRATSRSQLTRAKRILQQKINMLENLQLCQKNISAAS